LRQLRQVRGSTQEQLAHDASLTIATLAPIERGETNPRWTTVRRIVCALEVSLADLVGVVEDEQ
jgi:transcriptional regulator with XRE-family HTH domain